MARQNSVPASVCILSSILFATDFLKRFKAPSQPTKRPVGRPRTLPAVAQSPSGPSALSGASSSASANVISPIKIESSNDSTNDNVASDSESAPPPKKTAKHGHYRLYTVHFKQSVVTEMMNQSIASVAAKYNLPRSTITSRETQFRRKNKRCPSTVKGCHLRSGSGRQLSYPKEVDEEILEWVLVRQDAHLPVSRTLIRVKARHLVRPHNSDFGASSGWLQKFMIRHGLSLRCKTSISQKLPAQLEHKLECFLNKSTYVLMPRWG